MKRVLLDTNVLVSVLTDRDPRQQAQATELFESASAGDVRLLLHQAVLSEMVYVLGNLYRVESRRIAEILGDLVATPGVEAIDEIRWPRVLDLWPARFPDFGNAILAAVAAERGDAEIATFDQRFVRRLGREDLASHWENGDRESPDRPTRNS